MARLRVLGVGIAAALTVTLWAGVVMALAGAAIFLQVHFWRGTWSNR